MKSRHVARIEEELAKASDPIQQAILHAKKACYLARIGGFEEAKNIVLRLREVYGDGRSGRVTIRIMLAEGLLHFYEAISPAAIDRIVRAQTLALAIRDAPLIALTSAWRAHLEFELSKYEAMGSSLQLSFDNAERGDTDAKARSAMVLADAFLMCGRRAESQYWYEQCRCNALESGDTSTVSALMYNRAAFGLAWLRTQMCFQPLAHDALKIVRLEVASARNFQDMIYLSALENLIGIWEARLLMMEASYALAIEKITTIRHKGPFAQTNFSQDLMDLELAFTHFKVGDYANAQVSLTAIQNSDFPSLDIDDRLVACWMRLQMADADPRFGDASALRSTFQRLTTDFQASTQVLASALDRFAVAS